MSRREWTIRVQLQAQLALLGYSVLLGLWFGLQDAMLTAKPLAINLGHAMTWTVGTYIVGLLPVVLLGAPLYAQLALNFNMTALRAIALGGSMGWLIALLLIVPLVSEVHDQLGGMLFLIGSGAAVALGTHLLAGARPVPEPLLEK